MTISEDSSTPAVKTSGGGSTSASVTTVSFSPPASSVLVACQILNYATAPGTFPSLTASDSASGTWTNGPSISSAASFGKVQISTRPASTAPGSITATMTRGSALTAAELALGLRVVDGADVSSPQGASNTASGTHSSGTDDMYVSVTPQQTGSYIYVVVNHSSNGITNTAAAGTTTISDTEDSTDGGALLIGRYGPTTSTSAVSVGWSATLNSGDGWVGAALEILPAVTTVSGTASLSGSGTMAAGFESAGLSGQGTLTAAGALAGGTAPGLDGEGNLSAAGTAGQSAALAGEGDLSAAPTGTWQQYAGLDGEGALGLAPTGLWQQSAGLAGQGTLGTAVLLGLVIGLSGQGSLSIPQVAGGLVNGVGGATTPQALPGSSQVAVAAPGSSNWMWLGTLGQVTALTYSYVCPGGADQMQMTLLLPASYRNQILNPGWQVKIVRGGHVVWTGRLDEPQPSASGWTVTAEGTGNRGQDFVAYYTDTWPANQPDESINDAISRGLPWSNPGVGTPSGAWYGQSVDPGAQTITALLNLVCTRGALTWYVNSQPGGEYAGNTLSVFPLPTTVNRLLVCTTPVARTLGGYVNTIWLRFQSSADNTTTNTAATYATTSVQNAQSVAAHQVQEAYIDLSNAGTMTAAQAQAVGQAVLQIYQAATFNGPFTVSYGQLLNVGGHAIDIGTDQASTVCQLVLTDFAYGGSVTPEFPVTFVVGAYSYDDFARTATITPYQALDESLSGLLSMEGTVLAPIQAAST